MGGAAGCQWRRWQRWGGLEGMGRRCEREIAPDGEREAAPSLAGERGVKVSQSVFQVTYPSGLRPPPPHPSPHGQFGIGVSGTYPSGTRRNEDTRRGAASGNCRSGNIAAGPRRDPPPRRQLDRPVPSARSTPPRDLISSAVARCRLASPGSRAPRHDWTGLASRGARARSIGPCESRAARRAGGSAGGTQRPAAARCATRRRRDRSSGRSHGFGPCRESVRC